MSGHCCYTITIKCQTTEDLAQFKVDPYTDCIPLNFSPEPMKIFTILHVCLYLFTTPVNDVNTGLFTIVHVYVGVGFSLRVLSMRFCCSLFSIENLEFIASSFE